MYADSDLLPDKGGRGHLFGLRVFISAKQVVGLNTETLLQQRDRKEDISDKCQNNQKLYPGGLLNGLAVFAFANFAGTILCLFFVDERINFATQANPECRFEEEEDEANQADQTCYRAVGVDDDHQDKHGDSQKRCR